MMSQQTRILYQGDLPELQGKTLAIPANFRGQLRGWYPTPAKVTGTWAKPCPAIRRALEQG